jgi:hypothetical protein
MASIVDQLLAELGANPTSSATNGDLELLSAHDK